ncbi:toprim domain-containing protein [Nioella sp. MMSF_3534]|uniref:DUF7146 domain-containing protein n=1 Tax=Nioella sp. MMSF_3534 TaxID=3046720 RepID=UPI00273D2F54|nr:toprim domain-containing protein [Nioella sp. MMSF_3534]
MTSATELKSALGGIWRGNTGNAPCPVCQPEGAPAQKALAIKLEAGRVLFHCHKSSCAFADILAAAGLRRGAHCPPDREAVATYEAERKAQNQRKTEQAARVWKEARPIQGTFAEAYLCARGIKCPLPPSLRFHPDCWHGPSAGRYPAMIALVMGSGGFSVHRTYLRNDGAGKASLEPNKMMLGAVSGGAVRLTECDGRLVVCEGIETGLSLASGLLRRPATIWAALSTSGMRGLHLPERAGRLTIATDGDAAGHEAGNALAERACALGWQVSLLPAPNGRDWNDLINAKEGRA